VCQKQFGTILSFKYNFNVEKPCFDLDTTIAFEKFSSTFSNKAILVSDCPKVSIAIIF